MLISAFGLGQDCSYNGMVSKICPLLWIYIYKTCMAGGRFATHPSFPFLVFNMLVRSENRRISNIRMAKKSFDRVKQIYETLTSGEIKAAEEEYRETRTTTNPKVAYLLRELSAFGYGQHMSNEERLYERRQIHSLCLQNGGNNVWFTINPNDLTNEINMKLTAFRGLSGREAEKLFQTLQQHINSVQHTVRDPVSSAMFFHREISLFFEKYVRTGQNSVFGKVSCYFASVETNDRGALHLHGHLWLDANMYLPTLLKDMEKPENEDYREQVCEYIDSVFSEVR
jgi:Helitron helicase-like domain at N-terminus